MDSVCCGGEDRELRHALSRAREASGEAAYLFRLCCIRLVLTGQDPGEVGARFDLSERTVRRWVGLYRDAGAEALRHGLRAGRPGHLGDRELRILLAAMLRPPGELGLASPRWHGALVQQWVLERFGTTLGIRQCQRLLSLARHMDRPDGAPTGPRAAGLA